MSLSPNEKYPGRVAVDPNYQDGKFKDSDPSTANNGSPLKAIDRNEQLALQEAVMDAAGFEYSGVADTPQNSQMFKAYKAALSNGANLLSNHNFLTSSPDTTGPDATQPPPSATPTSYPPGFQIFSGVFANETTGILNLTYIDGRVSFSGGDFYMAVPSTGVLENITEFAASVADFDGKPRTRGVSYALVGGEYRVTVGVDALEDESANETLLGSVKFEQGSVATGHEVNAALIKIVDIENEKIFSGSVFPKSDSFASTGSVVPSGTLFLKTSSVTKWIALVDELPELPQEIASINDYEVTFTNGYRSPLLPLTARFTNEVTFEMFGANRNSVILPNPLRYAINPTLTPIVNSSSDDLDAINKCIAYCAPYEFVTDIQTTRALMGNVRAKIVGNGNFRVTDSVKINPFLCIEGDKKGGFFGENGGLNIYGDFDDKARYILDTAPMFVGGNRPLGETYQRNDFDSGSTPGCPGWSISKLGVNALPGRTIKGALNRQIAQQSRVTDCSLGTYWQRCYEGIKSSVCWGGVVSDNHIRGSAYSLRNENDITTDLQYNNYLTVSGTKPSNTDYTYVNWPNADLQDKTSCIVNRFSDPHMRDNTCEGAEIGVQSFGSQFAVRDDGNYYEKIKEYIYGLHTVNAELKPKWVFCEDAELVSVRGGSLNLITLDLTSTSSLSVKGFGTCESLVSRGVKVLGSARVYNLPYNSRFHLHDAEIDGVLNIYVDNVGDDANIGYSVQNPVQTIQEALGRCKKGASNVINIIPGEVVNTKYQLGSGTVTNTVLSGLDISFVSEGTATIDVGSSSGQTHCIPMDSGSLTFDGVDVKLTNSATTGGYRTFFRTLGNVDFNLKGMQIYGTSGNAIFGSQYGKGGSCRISMNDVTLGNNLDFTYNSGEAKGFSWIETSSRVTNNGTSVGNGSTGQIFSTTF